MTTPTVVKGNVIPKVLASQAPNSPRRLKASRSAMPPTTGGSTIGKVVKARRRLRPGNATRAYTHASGTPRTTATALADKDQINESFIASNDSGDDRAVTASQHL